MRYDPVPKRHQHKNLFRYSRIIKEYERRIDLEIVINGRPKHVGLPKKYVSIFPADQEVVIPEWLCEKENLL